MWEIRPNWQIFKNIYNNISIDFFNISRNSTYRYSNNIQIFVPIKIRFLIIIDQYRIINQVCYFLVAILSKNTLPIVVDGHCAQ